MKKCSCIEAILTYDYRAQAQPWPSPSAIDQLACSISATTKKPQLTLIW